MSLITQILLVIPCICSCITTAIYAYIAYQNFKKPKDEIWETAVRICQSTNNYVDANNFAQVYEQLRFFKEHGCKLDGLHLLQFMQEAEAQSAREQPGNTRS